MKFEAYKNEVDYTSPDYVSDEALKKIKSAKVGMKVLDVFHM
jgi:hypothetical protein